jgi:hypothetical protein
VIQNKTLETITIIKIVHLHQNLSFFSRELPFPSKLSMQLPLNDPQTQNSSNILPSFPP